MRGRKRDKLDNRKFLVRRLYNSGMTDQDISLEMEVSRRAVSYWRRRNGLPRRSRKGRVYATWHRRAVLLISEGWTLEAVCEHVGKRRATVQRVLLRRKNAADQ